LLLVDIPDVFELFSVKLQVDCFDFDSDGDHDLIGSFMTTASELMQAATQPVCSFLLLFASRPSQWKNVIVLRPVPSYTAW